MRVALVACLCAVACAAPERVSPRPVATPQGLIAPGLRLPDHVTPLRYDLTLDIDPDSEIFKGEVHIEARIERPTDHVWLHADQLEIATARWDGGELTKADVPGEQMTAFRFGRIVEPRATVKLSFTFTGKMLADQEGLFRQRDGAWYVFSQGEAVFARRFTPCFDEPRWKTPWRVTLVVPKQHVALSNMPVAASTPLRGNKKQVVFAETPPLPSYLVAIAVGPFELVDVGKLGKNQVPVRVAVRQGQGKRTSVVAARLPGVIDAMERYLDEGLPYAKLDIVGVPRFFGAMENPGLITFHEQILLGDPKHEGFANYFTFIAAHEIAHQWFGNLVTPAWWDHLWLSEAFASWLGDKVVRELGAYDDPPLRLALARREAIDADRAGDAKPLWRQVTTTEEADEGFDAIAYAKGQLVLASFEAFVGAEAFRAIVKSYVGARRGGTVTSEDLVQAVATATTPELAAAFRRHAALQGTPIVELALSCDGAPKLVAQSAEPVPLCVRHGTTRSCALVTSGKRTELAVGATCPATVLGNVDGAYYHVRWASHGPRGPAPRVLDLDPAARVIAGDDVAAAIRRGELTASEAITELRAFADTKDPYALLGAVAIARALDPLVDDPARAAWETWLANRFIDQLGPPKKDRSAAELELANALLAVMPPDQYSFVVTRRAAQIVDKLIPDAQGELPGPYIALAAVHGGDKLFDRIAARARLLRDPEWRASWLAALGEFPAAQLPKALELVTKADLDPVAAWPAVARYLERSATRTAAWQAVKAQLPTIVQRMGDEAGDVIDALAHVCDAKTRDEIVTTLASQIATVDAGKTRLAATLSSIERCITSRAKLGDISAALAASR